MNCTVYSLKGQFISFETELCKSHTITILPVVANSLGVSRKTRHIQDQFKLSNLCSWTYININPQNK